MCIGIYKPGEVEVDDWFKQRLNRAWEANPDGCGFMFAQDSKIHWFKGVVTFEELWDKFIKYYNSGDEFKYRDYIFHFRTASASQIQEEMCHPHFVNDDLAFAHNGNLFEFSNRYGNGFRDDKSDSQRFNERVLQEFPGDFLRRENIRNKLEEFAKNNHSKFIFLNSAEEVTIINESAGQWENGIWFSNGGIKNYSGYGYSGAYYYKPDEIRHPGGLITTQVFSEERRKKWEQCSDCKGWYKKEYTTGNACHGCNTLKELLRFCINKAAV